MWSMTAANKLANQCLRYYCMKHANSVLFMQQEAAHLQVATANIKRKSLMKQSNKVQRDYSSSQMNLSEIKSSSACAAATM